jgi:hypothetical protein
VTRESKIVVGKGAWQAIGFALVLIVLGVVFFGHNLRPGASNSEPDYPTDIGVTAAGAVACTNPAALDRLVALSSDHEAFANFVLHPATNGCWQFSPGRPIVIEEATMGTRKFHVRGSTQPWWTLREWIVRALPPAPPSPAIDIAAFTASADTGFPGPGWLKILPAPGDSSAGRLPDPIFARADSIRKVGPDLYRAVIARTIGPSVRDVSTDEVRCAAREARNVAMVLSGRGIRPNARGERVQRSTSTTDRFESFAGAGVREQIYTAICSLAGAK